MICHLSLVMVSIGVTLGPSDLLITAAKILKNADESHYRVIPLRPCLISSVYSGGSELRMILSTACIILEYAICSRELITHVKIHEFPRFDSAVLKHPKVKTARSVGKEQCRVQIYWVLQFFACIIL